MRAMQANYFSAMCAAVILFVFAAQTQAQTVTYVNQAFTTDNNTTIKTNWSFPPSKGDGPVLTSGTIDPTDEGWLRLTSDKANQESFVYYTQSIPTNLGMVFTFDFVIWGASSTCADGLTLAIFDDEVSPAAGGWGGSLGYAPLYSDGGLNGGIVGFGFDSFGNFSLEGQGRIGGLVKSPKTISIRGSMGDTRFDGYEYIAGAADYVSGVLEDGKLPDFATGNANSRDDATVQSVRLTITPAKLVTIELKPEGDVLWTTILDEYQCTLDCPEYIKLGFTASTGGVSSTQEIRNIVVTSYDEPLMIDLGSIEATWEDDAVVVNWITNTELDNAYFNVYRAESIKTANTNKRHKKNFLKKMSKWLKSKKAAKKGPYVKINATPIPALGESPYGAFYEVIDTNVQYGRRYWYKLEDVDLSGFSTQHGPCGPVSAWEDSSYMP